MASTDFITPANRPIRIGDVETNRPNSESINQKLGGSINFILERILVNEQFNMGGFFNANSYDDGAAGIRYIEKEAEIQSYYMNIRKTGSSGTSAFNVAIYDGAGAFINNLFGSGGNALSVTGGNGTNVIVGKSAVNTVSPVNVSINTAGHTAFFGTLNVTTIPAGSYLVPFVVSNANKAYNLFFNLKLKEL